MACALRSQCLFMQVVIASAALGKRAPQSAKSPIRRNDIR
jgi:hypothetical protein